MDPAITEAVVCFKRYRCESIKIENEMLDIISATRRKITETQALIVKADRLLDKCGPGNKAKPKGKFMSTLGHRQTCAAQKPMSALGHKRT